MKGKLALVFGAAAGYVLGAKAGTERYEQIKSQADRLWHDPKVQAKASQAQDLAKEKAPKLQEKASQVADKATSKVSSKKDSSTSTVTTPSPDEATPAAMPATKPPTAVDAPADSALDDLGSRPSPAAPQAGGSGV